MLEKKFAFIILLITACYSLISSYLVMSRSEYPIWLSAMLILLFTLADVLIVRILKKPKNNPDYPSWGISMLLFVSCYLPWVSQFTHNLNGQNQPELVLAMAGTLFTILLCISALSRIWAIAQLIPLGGDTP